MHNLLVALFLSSIRTLCSSCTAVQLGLSSSLNYPIKCTYVPGFGCFYFLLCLRRVLKFSGNVDTFLFRRSQVRIQIFLSFFGQPSFFSCRWRYWFFRSSKLVFIKQKENVLSWISAAIYRLFYIWWSLINR